MLRWQIRLVKKIYIILDLLAVIIGYYVLTFRWNQIIGDKDSVLNSLETIGYISIIAIVYFSIFNFIELYDSYIKSTKAISLRLLAKSILAFAPSYFLSYGLLLLMISEYTHLDHLQFNAGFFVSSVFFKGIYGHMRLARTMDEKKTHHILVLGQSANGAQYVDAMHKHYYLHHSIVGFLHIKNPPKNREKGSAPTRRSGAHLSRIDEFGNIDSSVECNVFDMVFDTLHYWGGLEELEKVVNNHAVDELVVTRSLSYDERLEDALKPFQRRGITITMLLKRHNFRTVHATVAMIENIPALKFHTVSLDEGQLMAKRVLDVIGSLVGMVLFGITYLIFAPLIKLESKGPVIFKQDRVGKNGRVFKIHKFRTMCDDAEVIKKDLAANNEIRGHMFKMMNDPRVTRIGNFLRKTSLDELPQFYNVLMGQMSLVGTRPPTLDEVKEYQTHHYKRLSIIPGITGMWQISGRSAITDFEEVVQLDNSYIDNWTIWRDLKIIAKTVVVVLRRQGSH